MILSSITLIKNVESYEKISPFLEPLEELIPHKVSCQKKQNLIAEF